MIFSLVVVLIFLQGKIRETFGSREIHGPICDLSDEIKSEIKSYIPIVERMRKLLEKGFKHKTYNDLEDFIDTVGPRLSGSDGLEHAIEYLSEKIQSPSTGLKSFKKEEVQIPKQAVGTATAEMILPRKQVFQIINERVGIQNTPPTGYLAKVVVVSTFTELQARRNEIKGRILVINFRMEDYADYADIKSRTRLAITTAIDYGVLAVLIRSFTHFSLYTPEDFIYSYLSELEDGGDVVLMASMAVEDVELMSRIQARGKTIVMKLVITGFSNTVTTSYNLISDYKGTSKADEFVIVSGHMDNVKVGLGAQDDGVGVFLSLNTVKLLNHLEIRAKRTLRLILWTAEEFGLIGAEAFIKTHANELKDGRYRAALEADIGCGGPPAFITSKSNPLDCIVKEVLTSIFKYEREALNLWVEGGNGTDVLLLQASEYAVPAFALGEWPNGTYFWYHHSEGDMMNAVDSDDLDTCLLVYAATAYILADMDIPN